jgi:hypothetical protein
MTAKIRTKSNPTFIAAVARVHPELAAWRQRRKVREPIPEALWRAMVSLARRYGLSPVAQALKVNYMTLKQHLLASTAAQVSRSNPPASFVEVPLTGWAGGSQWMIELEDGGGSKLTVRLAQGDSASAVALVQGLWSQRS